jgi:hypothetical protein
VLVKPKVKEQTMGNQVLDLNQVLVYLLHLLLEVQMKTASWLEQSYCH